MTTYYALDDTSWKLLKHLVAVVNLTDTAVAGHMRDIMEVAKEVDL